MRDTGWNPVRRACSRTITDTAPYAFVPGSAKNRSATSRCTITHQDSSSGTPVSVSATSGVATLYGRLATSFRGSGSSAGDVEGEGVAEGEGHVDAFAQRRAQGRLEPPVDLDGMDVPHAVGEEGRQDAKARPDLQDDVALPRARRGGR